MSKSFFLLFLSSLACAILVFPSAPLSQEVQATRVKLTLQEAVKMALDRSPDVLIANAQGYRSREALREVRSSNLPQVTIGTGMAYNNGFPLSLEGSAPAIFQVGFSQAFLSKKNKNLIREAEAENQASQIGIETARNDLASAIAVAYCELHHSRQIEALWIMRLQSTLREQGKREALLQAGRVRPLDVTLAKTAAAEVKQRLLVSHEQVRFAETQLRELTGLPDSSYIETEEPRFTPDPLNLSEEKFIQTALDANPEVHQAEVTLKAREHHAQAEVGEKYPRLEIIGQYALFSKENHWQDYFNRFSRNNFVVGLSIQVPVFTGFRTSARVAQSQAEIIEARFRLQRLKSGLKLSLERCASALRIARGAYELASREVETAKESLDIQESLMESGRAEAKDVDAARDLLHSKETDQIEANKTLFLQQVELLRLSGTLAIIIQPKGGI